MKNHAVMQIANVAMRGVAYHVSRGSLAHVIATATVVRRGLVAVAKNNLHQHSILKTPEFPGFFYGKMVNDILRLFIISSGLILMR